MALNTPFALLGAGIGAAAVATSALLIGTSMPAVAIAAGVAGGLVIVAYIVAAFTMGSAFGEVLRGLLIGINSGLNFAILHHLLSLICGSPTHPAALAVPIALAAVNFLTVVSVISRSNVFQFVLGYLNWFLPMSWLIVALGFTFFVLNLLGGLIGLAGPDFFKLKQAAFDWKTGSLFIKGGWISNLNPENTAYNMGNFCFVDKIHGGMEIEHEAGHTLNLAAFGSIFHLVGAIDENIIRNGSNAFSERLADSNDPHATSTLPMWAQ